MITGNEPAQATDFLNNETGNVEFSQGLTIRQYFAGQQMAACRMASPKLKSEILAEQAILDTDALIKELNKNPAVTGLNDITTNKTQK